MGWLTNSRVTILSLAAVFAYLIPKGSISCPFCGSMGVHPWEWGTIVGA